ncbi:putative DNA repair protein [Dirofilaria immitis]
MKRQRIENHVNNGDGYISYVEKLYRKTQENYEEAGGFMDDDDEYASIRERIAEARQKRIDEAAANSSSLVPPDNCIDCKKSLCNSYLWEKFNYPVCDTCRNDKGAHKLISRTEAKNQYLLKDCDFDLRKPILRFISKKNPHNPRYGDMKLYLKAQLEQRCLEVYGSKEEFEKAKEARNMQKETRLEKRFEKKIKEMRQQVHGSKIFKTGYGKAHDHVFGDEAYDSKKDEYWKICKICGYKLTYEKM